LGLRYLLLLLIALPVWSADDADAIVRQLIAAQRLNDKRAQQYTYVEETERFIFDKSGKARRTGTETHEVIFVEGLKFNKLVARNNKPLSKREQERVEKGMRLTAEERRRHQRPTAPGGVITLSGIFTRQSVDLGSLRELLTLFDNRLVGQEEVRGRKAWVIESTPRAGYLPMSEHERQVLVFRKKFWVDQADHVLARAIYTVAAENAFLRPGSSLTFDSEKIDPEIWETVSLSLDFSRAKEPVFRLTGRTLYRMSDFKKFDVQSTITVIDPGK